MVDDYIHVYIGYVPIYDSKSSVYRSNISDRV